MVSTADPIDVERVAQVVREPDRPGRLHDLGLVDAPPEEAFDRVSRLATRLLGVPVALVSFVDADRQFFKSAVGLAEPWAAARQTPLTHSFCQYVVGSGRPLVVDDARVDPMLRDNRAIDEMGVIAYAGVPVRDAGGRPLGSFCAIDSNPRNWSEADLATLTELADMATGEVRLRAAVLSADRERREKRALLDAADEGIYGLDAEGLCTFVNPAAERLLGRPAADLLGKPVHRLVRPARPDGTPYADDDCPAVRAVRRGIGCRVSDEVFARPDGSTFPVEYACQPVVEGGVVRGAVVSFTDITPRREAEARLQAEQARLREEQDRLRQAQATSDRLLLSIFPRAVAERLKASPGPIADAHPAATVLFADVHRFSQLMVRRTPAEVVGLLGRLFAAFDDLAERHGVEKIKTIGDTYMAAAGVPAARPDHAEAVADLALSMQAAAAKFGDGLPEPLSLRVGIHSGPLVAGVIGTRKLAYDLWGQTVDLAAQLEAQGVSGSIQVSAATAKLLAGKYQLQERGAFYVAGAGEVQTHLLIRRR